MKPSQGKNNIEKSAIGFVFTNYNNSGYSKAAVESIVENNSERSYKIVIVDNSSASSDIEKLKLVKLNNPEIELILNDKNVGYFKGLNIGLKFLQLEYPEIRHIVVGNNDLIFPKNFISEIRQEFKLFEIHPVISPDIITLDGEHQNPHVINKLSKLRELIYDLYYSNFILSQIILIIAKLTKKITDRRDETHFEKAQMISQGYGACYILGPVFLEEFGTLWAPTFLMGEEYFLSKQLEKKDMKVFYTPKIKVNHHDHATMGQLGNRKLWKISKASHQMIRKIERLKP